MNSNSVVRGLLSVMVAVTVSGASPVLAAGRGSASQSQTTASAAIQAATTCTAGAKACPLRITFATGAYSGQAHSRLTGIHDQKWFVVKARAGQAMIVIVKGAGATRGIVYAPNGTSSGQPGGRVYDAVLPASGDYRIRVTESPMGEGWAGGIDVIVVIY